MKKLLITAAVALAAIGLNAATINWGTTKGSIYDGVSANKLTSGTAYLMFVTNSYTQGDLVSDFYTAKGDVASTITAMTNSGAMAIGAGTIGDTGRVNDATSTYASTDTATMYFVVFNDDMMYVSITADVDYDSVTGSYSPIFASTTGSSKTELPENAAYSTAGWYSVPEPTSGMLLLVGCALMALKRKRA